LKATFFPVGTHGAWFYPQWVRVNTTKGTRLPGTARITLPLFCQMSVDDAPRKIRGRPLFASLRPCWVPKAVCAFSAFPPCWARFGGGISTRITTRTLEPRFSLPMIERHIHRQRKSTRRAPAADRGPAPRNSSALHDIQPRHLALALPTLPAELQGARLQIVSLGCPRLLTSPRAWAETGCLDPTASHPPVLAAGFFGGSHHHRWEPSLEAPTREFRRVRIRPRGRPRSIRLRGPARTNRRPGESPACAATRRWPERCQITVPAQRAKRADARPRQDFIYNFRRSTFSFARHPTRRRPGRSLAAPTGRVKPGPSRIFGRAEGIRAAAVADAPPRRPSLLRLQATARPHGTCGASLGCNKSAGAAVGLPAEACQQAALALAVKQPPAMEAPPPSPATTLAIPGVRAQQCRYRIHSPGTVPIPSRRG